jgi:hypothetical protein
MQPCTISFAVIGQEVRHQKWLLGPGYTDQMTPNKGDCAVLQYTCHRGFGRGKLQGTAIYMRPAIRFSD